MGKYDDIINLPHHISSVHPQMSRYDRAAQFSPFAALTGHEEAIEETARLTDDRIELSEGRREELDYKLKDIIDNPGREYNFTVFIPDSRKSGGSYEHRIGIIKKIDDFNRQIILTDGSTIYMDYIYNVERIGYESSMD